MDVPAYVRAYSIKFMQNRKIIRKCLKLNNFIWLSRFHSQFNLQRNLYWND